MKIAKMGEKGHILAIEAPERESVLFDVYSFCINMYSICIKQALMYFSRHKSGHKEFFCCEQVFFSLFS